MQNENTFVYKSIENFYDRVRSCLNVKENTISNICLDYPENAPTAERRVKSMVLAWEELDGEKLEMFYTCIVYMTCYIMCPVASSRRIVQQSTPTLSVKYSDDDTSNGNCNRFLQLVDELVLEINKEKFEPFVGFNVTSCTRYHKSMFPSR